MKPRYSITLTEAQTKSLTEAFLLLEYKVDMEYFNVNGYPLQFRKAKFTPKQLKWIAHSLESNGIVDPDNLKALFERLRSHKKEA